MKDKEFSPRETMERVLERWWIVLILTILAGVAGWIFHFFQPPVYEATASITINLYFDQRELTQYEADTALNAAGDIFNSSRVIDTLRVEAQKRGLSSQEISRIQHNTSLEARESVWELHVRDRDPEAATEYVNLWASIAEQMMNEALEHALSAEQLQGQIKSLQSCLPSATPVPDPVPAPEECQSYSLDEINAHVQAWATEMADEQRLSRGILPITTITLSRFATVPEEPVLYGQASLVLAGACIGFFISLWVANNLKVRRRD